MQLNYLRQGRARHPYLLLALVWALAGCSSPEVLPSKAELLTQHSWHLSAWTSSPAYPIAVGGVQKQYTDILEFCRATNNTCLPNQRFSFGLGAAEQSYEQGAYAFQQGTAACGTQYLAQSGSWYTDASTGKILLYLEDIKSTPQRRVLNAIYTVSELSGNTLIMSYRVGIVGSSTVYTYTFTFTAE